jgi:hypothetical protein
VNERNLEILKENKSLNSKQLDMMNRFERLRASYRSDHRAVEFLQSWNVQHNHPFLAGAQFLDTLYQDQEIGNFVMESYSQNPRFVPTLYRIFQQNGLIEERIDYMEDYLNIFEKVLFFRHGKSLPDPLDPSFEGFNYKNYLKLRTGIFQLSQTGKPKTKFETVEKLVPLPTNVSKLFAILRNDDFSEFENETVFSKDGMEELIKLTESELLGGGYLSVDIFKYFISFNMFAIHIGKASPQIKQLFQETGQENGGNFLLLFQQFFIDYVADYLSKPIKVRTEKYPQRTKIVKHFIELMTSYFNDVDKMSGELFIIPRLGSWKEIYLSVFHESLSWNMDKLTDPALKRSGSRRRSIIRWNDGN